MKKLKILLLSVCLVALGWNITQVAFPVFAVPEVYIYPEENFALTGQSFTIDVKITGASNVFAWEFQFRWNASVLNVTDIAEGGFLKGFEQAPTHLIKGFNQTVGTLYAACSRLGNLPGVSGDGVLAKITFLVEIKGATALDLFSTKLRDSVPNPIDHTSKDGTFSSLIDFPRASFTYSPLKANIDQPITFDATDSNDTNPDGYIVSYFWDFGDGTTTHETLPTVDHAYSEGGIKRVTLTVTDNDGWNNSLTKEVKVRFAHDVMVVSISESHSTVSVGDTVTITVKVGNEGSNPESFSVTAYYDSTSTGLAQSVTNLAVDQNRTLTFQWNTADVAEGTYRIKAVAETLSGETNTDNNTMLGGTVTVTPPAQFPWLMVGGGIAAVGVIVVLALFLMRRRGKTS
jgi:PKD repeat protein